MIERLTMRAFFSPEEGSVRFFVGGYADWYKYVAEPVAFVLRERLENDLITPTFTLHEDAARHLMETLWNSGIRPARFRESEVSSQAKHLQDMRALVSNAYKVELK